MKPSTPGRFPLPYIGSRMARPWDRHPNAHRGNACVARSSGRVRDRIGRGLWAMNLPPDDAELRAIWRKGRPELPLPEGIRRDVPHGLQAEVHWVARLNAARRPRSATGRTPGGRPPSIACSRCATIQSAPPTLGARRGVARGHPGGCPEGSRRAGRVVRERLGLEFLAPVRSPAATRFAFPYSMGTAYSDVRAQTNSVRPSGPPKSTCVGRSGMRIVSTRRPSGE